jgi:hypothetical protein
VFSNSNAMNANFFSILTHTNTMRPERCRKDVNEICIQAIHKREIPWCWRLEVGGEGGKLEVSALCKCMSFTSAVLEAIED